jgi:carbamoyl-phosphate synthase large subunit
MGEELVVVVTGAGSTIGLGVAKALQIASNQPDGVGRIRIVGVDSNPLAVGHYCLEKSYLAPSASPDFEPYFQALVNICKREGAAILFSGWDGELIPLGQRRQEFFEQSGAQIGHRPEGIREASDKWLTFECLKRAEVPTPASILPEDSEALDWFMAKYKPPYILKPRVGAGSRGLFQVSTIDEIRFLSSYLGSAILQEELLPADEEYTIGVFMMDRGEEAGTLVLKRSLMSGLSYRMEVVENKEIAACAVAAVRALGLVGAANVQLRRTPDGPKVFEVNPRFSSSTSVRAFFGFNEPECAIRYFYKGERPLITGCRRGYALRYWEEMFVGPEAPENAQKGIFEKGLAFGLVESGYS